MATVTMATRGAAPGSPGPGPEDRYSRQQLFRPFGDQGQARLRDARILIVGCGALGSHAAEYLARAGVGSLRLVDRDVVEWSNLHRQLGYDESDALLQNPKAEALARHLARINSTVELEPRVEDFNATSAGRLTADCTLYLDGTDNIPARFLLNDVSYREGLPWIYAGAVGDTAHTQFFDGIRGPCLRCQLPDAPPPGALATCDTAGVLGPTVGIAAAWQVALTLRFLAQGSSDGLRGRKTLTSLWSSESRVVDVEPDPECPVCVHRQFLAADGTVTERAAVLCGRGAVQILPAATGTSLDMALMAARLGALGEVEKRPGLLRAPVANGVTLTLFSDGRAIFDGLTNTSRARSLYARFIGQ